MEGAAGVHLARFTAAANTTPGEHESNVDADRLIKIYWDADQPIDPSALRGAVGWPGTCA
jgi:hypothetical protein